MRKISRGLNWLAGADLSLIDRSGEAGRFGTVGFLMLEMMLNATIAMALAVNMAFRTNAVVSIGIGVLFGMFMLAVDRFVILLLERHVGTKKGVMRRLAAALPRVMFIGMPLAFVIGVPVTLAALDTEIGTEMTTIQAVKIREAVRFIDTKSDLAGLRAALVAEKASVSAGVDAARARVEDALDAFSGETFGTAGTRVVGYGPVARQREAQLAAARAELAAAEAGAASRLTAINERLASVDEQLESRRAEARKRIEADTGLAARYAALDSLSDHDHSIFVFRAGLTIFLLLIDASAVVLVAIAPPGEHARLVETAGVTRRLEADAAEAAKRYVIANSFDVRAAMEQEILTITLAKERAARVAAAKAGTWGQRTFGFGRS